MWIKTDYWLPKIYQHCQLILPIGKRLPRSQPARHKPPLQAQFSLYRIRNTGTRFAFGWNFSEKLFVFSEGAPARAGDENFFFVSDQRPDLATQDLQNFLVEKSSDARLINIVFWWSIKRSKTWITDPRPFFCIIVIRNGKYFRFLWPCL